MCLWFWGLLCSLHINLRRHNTPQYHLHQAQYQLTIPLTSGTIPHNTYNTLHKNFHQEWEAQGKFYQEPRISLNLQRRVFLHVDSSKNTVRCLPHKVRLCKDICHRAFYRDTLTMVRLDFDAFTLANPSIEGRCSGTDYIQVSVFVFASVFLSVFLLVRLYSSTTIYQINKHIFNWQQLFKDEFIWIFLDLCDNNSRPTAQGFNAKIDTNRVVYDSVTKTR